MIRYSPFSSETALRTFSISTGLAASTVTPGSTAPDVSFTVPATLAALVPCAQAIGGISIRHNTPPAPMLIGHLIGYPPVRRPKPARCSE